MEGRYSAYSHMHIKTLKKSRKANKDIHKPVSCMWDHPRTENRRMEKKSHIMIKRRENNPARKWSQKLSRAWNGCATFHKPASVGKPLGLYHSVRSVSLTVNLVTEIVAFDFRSFARKWKLILDIALCFFCNLAMFDLRIAQTWGK